MKDLLCKVVELRTQPGEHHGFALVYGYQEAPTYLLQFADGHKGIWAANLCKPASPLDEAAFWKARAEALEKQLEGEQLRLKVSPKLALRIALTEAGVRHPERFMLEAPVSDPLTKLIELLHHRTTYRDSGTWENHVVDTALLALPDLEVLASRCRLEPR